jgi:hypothetical protein
MDWRSRCGQNPVATDGGVGCDWSADYMAAAAVIMAAMTIEMAGCWSCAAVHSSSDGTEGNTDSLCCAPCRLPLQSRLLRWGGGETVYERPSASPQHSDLDLWVEIRGWRPGARFREEEQRICRTIWKVEERKWVRFCAKIDVSGSAGSWRWWEVARRIPA